MMTGSGPIVLRIQQHGYHEHMDVPSAHVEAKRLCEELGGAFVIYVPVGIVRPAEKTTTERLPGTRYLEDDDDLPF
jgi:hypothetical protein